MHAWTHPGGQVLAYSPACAFSRSHRSRSVSDMQTSMSARKLHETLHMLHRSVSDAITQPHGTLRIYCSNLQLDLSSSCCYRRRSSNNSQSSSGAYKSSSRSCTSPVSASQSPMLQCRAYTTAEVATDAEQAAKTLEPALYVVGTPIGNLEDMTFRAIRILQGVNLILAEDTRHTRKLLEHFGIRTPTLSCHEHNEKQRQELVLQRLQQGEPIALVSDAGMPAISDPGAVIVSAAVAAGIHVVPVPGPCAAIAALAAAGLPTDSFYFAGFLPPKSGKRTAALHQLQHISATLVFYAPPHGLSAILLDLVEVLGPHRHAVVARELTKMHEEFFRGPLQEVLEEFGPEGKRAVKGEVVLLVSGCSADEQQYQMLSAAAAGGAATSGDRAAGTESREAMMQRLIARELTAGKSVSATAKALSQQLQIPRSKVYKLALELAGQPQGNQQ